MSNEGWRPDPSGRFEFRYFDGERWTENVSSGGRQWVDPGSGGPNQGTPMPVMPVYVANQVPVAPTVRTNGLAVAALVLGIIGAVFGLLPLAFFISIPLGVLALIFGLIGRSRARRGAPRRGMSIAGFVLGLVALGLGIAGVFIVDEAVDDFNAEIDDIFGPASPDEYTTVVESCGRNERGYAEAAGTIRNDADREMSFTITVEFLDPSGVRLADSIDFVSSLRPGDTARWSVGGFEEIPPDGDCRLVVE